MKKLNNKLNIVFLDIENAPNIGYVWSKWETNVIEYTQDWFILCMSWKWLGEKTQTTSLPDFNLYASDKKNDKEVMKVIWKVLDSADVVVAHNGAKFDIRKINARFIYHGMTPPSHYTVIDTLKVARKYFQFDSNSLDELGRYLKLGNKSDMGGFGTFKGCIEGDMDSWKRMIKYNRQDIVVLEKLYLQLRPWIENHPSLNEVTDTPKDCPACHSENIHKRGVDRLSNNREKQRFQCQGCGKWFGGKVYKITNKNEVQKNINLR